MPANNKILIVLANRQFFFLWVAEIFAQLAFNMMNFILLIVAFQLSGSNTAVSGIVLSFTVPAIIFGLLAGVYVDRWDKKKVLLISNIIRVPLLLILAFFHSELLILYILAFLIAIVTQFFIPAETPVIPLIVDKKHLLAANALFSMGIYGTILVAYSLSGPFLILFGTKDTFLILSFFFLLAAICISLIKVPKQQKTMMSGLKKGRVDRVNAEIKSIRIGIGIEIKDAFSHIMKTKEVYQSLFLLTLSQILILILAVIGPGFAHHILGIKVNELPLVFVTPAAVGMIVGAVIIGNFMHGFSRTRMTNMGLFLAGLSILLLPIGSKVTSREIVSVINAYLPPILSINIFHIMVILAFVLGFANALIFVPSNTVIQEKTTDEVRGKIYGALNALVGISSILPVIMVGGLADSFGVDKVLYGIGFILLVLSALRTSLK